MLYRVVEKLLRLIGERREIDEVRGDEAEE
jgi:hypothetical protein